MRVQITINLPGNGDIDAKSARKAFEVGIQDGLDNPEDLGSGLTFDDHRITELYDEFVNLGQAIGKLFPINKENNE